ncbi:hypothetical protein ABVK25_012481 [Lepraria finkii]|uniref:Secreted protein n=1 Tax=Lepraria finkii TaxID=1340010 RepID=A0ABR4AG77_9LECA
MSCLSHCALIRLLALHTPQLRFDTIPTPVLWPQSHPEDELYRERYHRVSSSDIVTNQTSLIPFFQLSRQRVKIFRYNLSTLCASFSLKVAPMRWLYRVGRQWTIKAPSAAWMKSQTLARWLGLLVGGDASRHIVHKDT